MKSAEFTLYGCSKSCSKKRNWHKRTWSRSVGHRGDPFKPIQVCFTVRAVSNKKKKKKTLEGSIIQRVYEGEWEYICSVKWFSPQRGSAPRDSGQAVLAGRSENININRGAIERCAFPQRLPTGYVTWYLYTWGGGVVIFLCETLHAALCSSFQIL